MINNVTIIIMIKTPKIIITITTKTIQNIKLSRGIKNAKTLTKEQARKKNLNYYYCINNRKNKITSKNKNKNLKNLTKDQAKK